MAALVYSEDLIRSLALRHGFSGDVSPMPNGGMVNEPWLLGNSHVLRIMCREGCEKEAETESAIVPFLMSEGIPTPALAAAGFAESAGNVPYTVYERAKGELLAYLEPDHPRFERAYRQLGEALARLHRLQPPGSVKPHLHGAFQVQPRKWLARGLENGLVSNSDASAMNHLLGELESGFVDLGDREVLLHADVHPWNLFVDAESGQLESIIDWGDVQLGHPAIEFSSMPFPAIEPMLEGYAAAGGTIEPGFRHRAANGGLNVALWERCHIVGQLEDRFDPRWLRFPIGGWEALIGATRRTLDAV